MSDGTAGERDGGQKTDGGASADRHRSARDSAEGEAPQTGTEKLAPPFDIVVAGDIVFDQHIYQGRRYKPTHVDRAGVRSKFEFGGADGLFRLLEAITRLRVSSPTIVPSFGIEHPFGSSSLPTAPDKYKAYALWKPHAVEPGSKGEVWRADLLGYGDEGGRARSVPETPAAPSPHRVYTRRRAAPEPKLLVLDDAGYTFRSAIHREAWCLPEAEATDAAPWVLVKMSYPVGRGDLWRHLIQKFGQRLVCLVAAHDLRQEFVGLSRGLSWERVICDLYAGLRHNPTLADLRKCRHLIVTFSSDAALWIDDPSRASAKAMVLFDTKRAESQWADALDGEVTGYLTAMTASLAFHIAKALSNAKVTPDDVAKGLQAGLERGLAAMRDLKTLGHGPVEKDDDAGRSGEPDGFPVRRLAATICDATEPPSRERSREQSAIDEVVKTSKYKPARVALPWGDGVAPWSGDQSALERWTFVETAERPENTVFRASLLGLARLLVVEGPKQLEERFPHATFGKFTTFDRKDIEALRSVKKLMEDYRKDTTVSRPLSIGVFGPPGAGKSFGIKEIVTGLFGAKSWLEFNLSQFSDARDLVGPFHQSRDLTLSGITPVVFWDEFDACEHKWLQYLIAPMQDGRFQDGALNHSIGKSIFIFAGGTSPSFGHFVNWAGNPPNEAKAQAFALRKGPDFVSRLDAYYDVTGINPREVESSAPGHGTPPRRDPDDVLFPLRRALLIRDKLTSNSKARVDIDSDLLNALLLVSKYRHGSRSLSKLVEALRATGGRPVRRSSLPSQLSMLVDEGDFLGILLRHDAFRMAASIEQQARHIHETYLVDAREDEHPIVAELDRPYDDLDESDKEFNRAAARRIPDILALIGMGVDVPGEGKEIPMAEVDLHVGKHLERLATAEHEGWRQQRLIDGWRSGPRNHAARTHDRLEPFDKLDEDSQERIRKRTLKIPQRIVEAGCSIVWLDPAAWVEGNLRSSPEPASGEAASPGCG